MRRALVRPLLWLLAMHPALQPYVDPKPMRTWRYVLAGALIGMLGFRLALLVGSAL